MKKLAAADQEVAKATLERQAATTNRDKAAALEAASTADEKNKKAELAKAEKDQQALDPAYTKAQLELNLQEAKRKTAAAKNEAAKAEQEWKSIKDAIDLLKRQEARAKANPQEADLFAAVKGIIEAEKKERTLKVAYEQAQRRRRRICVWRRQRRSGWLYGRSTKVMLLRWKRSVKKLRVGPKRPR